jgi:hypothetical protein
MLLGKCAEASGELLLADSVIYSRMGGFRLSNFYFFQPRKNIPLAAMFLLLVLVVLLGTMLGPFILRILQNRARQTSQLPVSSEKYRDSYKSEPERTQDQFLHQKSASSEREEDLVSSQGPRGGRNFRMTQHEQFVAQLPPPTLAYAEMPKMPMDVTLSNRPQRKTQVFRSENGEVRTVVEESSMIANGGRWKRRMVVFGSGDVEDSNPHGIQPISELPVDMMKR